ncbi:hypothetical protein FACS1894133_2140 [Clostridia bacterium]|nr:hypothetical protein FACS1894133_2140 [Clostridia bacterium]
MPTVHIAYSLNDGYADYTLVSMVSVVNNLARGRGVTFHILYTELSKENKRRLATVCELFGVVRRGSRIRESVTVIFHDVTAYAAELCGNFVIEHKRLNVAAYYRLFIPAVIRACGINCDKVLYLDGDTVVRSDIGELYDEDVSGYYCGVVADDGMFGVPLPPARMPRLDALCAEYVPQSGKATEQPGGRGAVTGDAYFNSGVLLLNMAELYSADGTDVLLASVSSVADLQKRMRSRGYTFAEDQDYLNCVCFGKTKLLPLKYNFIPGNIGNVRTDLLYVREYADALLDPVVVHYGGAYLRDLRRGANLPYAHDWREYARTAEVSYSGTDDGYGDYGITPASRSPGVAARITAAYINSFYRYYKNIAREIKKNTTIGELSGGKFSEQFVLRGYDAHIAAAFVCRYAGVLPKTEVTDKPLRGNDPPVPVLVARVIRRFCRR